MKFSSKRSLEKFIYLLLLVVVQGLSDDHNIETRSARLYDKSGVCKETGYYRNETDPSQFYRCVDYYGGGKKYVIFKFSCPPALEFDEKLSACVLSHTSLTPVVSNNHDYSPTLASELFSSALDPETDLLTLLPPLESTTAINEFDVEPSSTVVPAAPSLVALPGSLVVPPTYEALTNSPDSQDKVLQTAEVVAETSDVIIPTLEIDCSSNKFYRLPNSDCNRFYQCHQRSVNIFSCAPGLVFDEGTERCLLPEESVCDQKFMKPVAGEKYDTTEIDCTSGQFLRYPFDCEHFYQCYSNGVAKSILFYSCSSGLVFDEKSSKCLLPYETSPCYVNDSPSKLSPFLYNIQRLFQSSPNEFSFQ